MPADGTQTSTAAETGNSVTRHSDVRQARERRTLGARRQPASGSGGRVGASGLCWGGGIQTLCKPYANPMPVFRARMPVGASGWFLAGEPVMPCALLSASSVAQMARECGKVARCIRRSLYSLRGYALPPYVLACGSGSVPSQRCNGRRVRFAPCYAVAPYTRSGETGCGGLE